MSNESGRTEDSYAVIQKHAPYLICNSALNCDACLRQTASRPRKMDRYTKHVPNCLHNPIGDHFNQKLSIKHKPPQFTGVTPDDAVTLAKVDNYQPLPYNTHQRPPSKMLSANLYHDFTQGPKPFSLTNIGMKERSENVNFNQPPSHSATSPYLVCIYNTPSNQKTQPLNRDQSEIRYQHQTVSTVRGIILKPKSTTLSTKSLPNHYQMWSILNAVFCCPMIAIFAIYMSIQTKKAIRKGELTEAKKYSTHALTLNIICPVVAILILLAYILGKHYFS